MVITSIPIMFGVMQNVVVAQVLVKVYTMLLALVEPFATRKAIRL